MFRMPSFVVLCCLMATWGFAQDPVQEDPKHYRVEFQDDQVRVLRITLRPHEQDVLHSHPDGVVVFLTADRDGKMPPAEAQWEPAGTQQPQTLTNTSFEAVFVELLRAPMAQPAMLPVVRFAFAPFYAINRPQVTRLFENDRVSVSKERFPGTARGDDFHAHPTDTVIVYLSGGEMDGTTGRAPSRARRGQVDVLPAYTLHRFTNLGFDPIEFIVIHPK